jgi:L-fucose isomerase-like protein
MIKDLKRREFLQVTSGCAFCLGAARAFSLPAEIKPLSLVSPGCIKSKVRVAKIYAGIPNAHWPTPLLDLKAEMQKYEGEFRRMKREFADVDFVANRLVTKPEQVNEIREQLKEVDGLLVIHLSMGISGMLGEMLKANRPTMIFAAPYSGHEWTSFGTLMKTKDGAMLDCILSSNFNDLAAAVRPFRAIHHLREAKIINVSTNVPSAQYLKTVAEKYGTEIRTIGLEPVMARYDSIDKAAAEEETERWIKQAEKVVEPPRDEIFRSAKLALAFEKVLADEQATVITVDCYGSMYRKLPAFPCVGNVRLNNMGLGGICESDLSCALTHVLLQGLTGKPGFISDPTMDESVKGIILAHCLGSMKMDGPDGPAAPYKLRTIMERQEGCVPQVKMRIGQKVTQLRIVGVDLIRHFTGKIIDVPDTDRGCRTKITVEIDGDPQKLWQNWAGGLHRQTVYGDITADLKRFCRFKNVQLLYEA